LPLNSWVKKFPIYLSFITPRSLRKAYEESLTAFKCLYTNILLLPLLPSGVDWYHVPCDYG
jgi:hypothetical protein